MSQFHQLYILKLMWRYVVSAKQHWNFSPNRALIVTLQRMCGFRRSWRSRRSRGWMTTTKTSPETQAKRGSSANGWTKRRMSRPQSLVCQTESRIQLWNLILAPPFNWIYPLILWGRVRAKAKCQEVQYPILLTRLTTRTCCERTTPNYIGVTRPPRRNR